MKKIIICLVALFVLSISGAASAAPLTVYDQGRFSIDATIRNNDLSSKMQTPFGSFDPSFDNKWNAEYGLTVGLGNKFALQYFGYNTKSDNTYILGANTTGKMNYNEFNVLYQFLKIKKNTLAVSLGYANSKITFDRMGVSTDAKKDMLVAGLVGTVEVIPYITLYASLNSGQDMLGYKIGISYEMFRNVELNLDWRWQKVKDYDFGAGTVDGTNKGFGVGVTVRI